MTDRGDLRINRAQSGEAELLGQLNFQLDEDEPHPYPRPLPALIERMKRWIETGEYQVQLFRRGSQVAGYAVWRLEDRGIYLRHFFICRDQRGQGLGRSAIRLLCRDVFPKGHPVQLDATITNKAGIAFWRAIGFRDFGITMELKAGEQVK